MAIPISIQLYTVRDLAQADYAGTVRRIAEIGYGAVEPAGFPGYSLQQAVALYAELGLDVGSAHLAMPVGEQRQQAIETAQALGAPYIVSGLGPDHFGSVDQIKAACDTFNRAAANAAAAGLAFAIHNHWWEFHTVDGRPAYQHMLDFLTPDVCFEIDTYWVATGGCDPAAVLRELGARAPLLHIKDGPCVASEPMTAVGSGRMDWAGVFAAARHARYAIVELDRCATDMMTAVADSYSYLTTHGFARGTR